MANNIYSNDRWVCMQTAAAQNSSVAKYIMVKHNNVIPNGHLKKDCQKHVKTSFNQPACKTRRRLARQKKAVKIFPRPTAGSLRPIIHGQTLKYNMKLRAGRGFSLRSFRNRSLEGLRTNVQRLKAYKEKLVVFPRHARKFKAGDSTPGDLATATQVQRACMPIVREKKTMDLVKVTNEMKSFKAYDKLHIKRTNQRHLGARLKKAAEAAKEEK